jgi:hypothetical protein
VRESWFEKINLGQRSEASYSKQRLGQQDLKNISSGIELVENNLTGCLKLDPFL